MKLKNLLVWNYKAHSFHIWYIASSRGPLPKLFKLLSSCLKLQGPVLSYLIYNIIKRSSTKFVQIMPLGFSIIGSTVTFDLFIRWATQGPLGPLVSLMNKWTIFFLMTNILIIYCVLVCECWKKCILILEADLNGHIIKFNHIKKITGIVKICKYFQSRS